MASYDHVSLCCNLSNNMVLVVYATIRKETCYLEMWKLCKILSLRYQLPLPCGVNLIKQIPD